MAKSLCKYSRGEIKAGKVSALIVDALFYCGSCARTSNQKGALCKAIALSSKSKKPSSSQLAQPLTSQLQPISTENRISVENKIATNVSSVVAKAKALKQQREFDTQASIKAKSLGVALVVPKTHISTAVDVSSSKFVPQDQAVITKSLLTKKQVKKELKRLTKSLKVQKKQKKQIQKLLEKQRKVAKKHKKLLKQELKFNQQEDKLLKQGVRIEKQLLGLSRSSVVH